MTVVAYTDGGARGNPGPAAAGVVLLRDGGVIARFGRYLGDALTNNWAEYQALILALKEISAQGLGTEEIEIRMDSELIVKQMRGEYKVKHPDLKLLHAEVQTLLRNMTHVTFSHIPRAQNKEADALVNEALDAVAAS